MSEEKKKCPGCAEMIPADASMCEYCGEKFNTSAQMEPVAENPELYAPQTAAKWSLLFTPVFGAYVLKNNWKALGQAPQEKRSKNLMIALVVIYAAGLLFLNEVQNPEVRAKIFDTLAQNCKNESDGRINTDILKSSIDLMQQRMSNTSQTNKALSVQNQNRNQGLNVGNSDRQDEKARQAAMRALAVYKDMCQKGFCKD